MSINSPSNAASQPTVRLTPTLRKRLGLSAASNKETITDLDKHNGVCRKTVRKARDNIDSLCADELCHDCDYLGDMYAIRMLPLCKKLGSEFDELEDEVLIALDATERTTSATENLNGRVKRCTKQRDHVDNHILELVGFYLNHSAFTSSSRED